MSSKVFVKLNQLLILCLSVVITNSITVCTASAVIVTVGDPSLPQPDTYCSITLKFKPSDSSSGSSGPLHAYVVCESVNPNGTRTKKGYRGGPSGMNDNDLVPDGSPTEGQGNEAPPCGSWNVWDGAWGPIDTYTGPYNEDEFPDFEGEDIEVLPTSPIDSFSVEKCDICDCLENMLAAMEDCCIAYELLGPNSNTVIYMALRHCMPGGTNPPLDSIPELLDISPVAWKFNKKIDTCLISYSY